MDDLRGRTAVVTGAGSGIGAALASAFGAHDMNLVLADLESSAVDDVAASLSARSVTTDVTDPASVDTLAHIAADAFGPVHVLVNNAGILRPGSTWEQPVEDWAAVFGVNVLGVVHGLHSFVPDMLACGEPCHVLNVASVGGLLAAPHMAAYIASKHAVVAITECLALEVAGTAMGVTVLCPGGVTTSIYRSEVERRRREGHVAGVNTEAVFDAMASPDRDDQTSPRAIAAVAIDAIKANRLYAMSFPAAHQTTVRARFAAIEAAMAADADH